MANLIVAYNGSNRISLTPKTTSQSKTMSCSGKYMATNITVTNAYDANLVAANILRNNSIFGVSGSSSTFKTGSISVSASSAGSKWCSDASWRYSVDYGPYATVSISSIGLSTIIGFSWAGSGSYAKPYLWRGNGSASSYGNFGHHGASRYMPVELLTCTASSIDLFSGGPMNDESAPTSFSGYVLAWGY